MLNIEEIIATIPTYVFWLIWDNADGTEGIEKFLNTAIGRAAAANLYNALKVPYKKFVYETTTGDVDLARYADPDFADWA
jgi:hypothetical protein